jgi:hypothetical protein
LTKTQIDKLGDRLRQGDVSEADLILLDAYRRSFSGVYEMVIRTIRDHVALELTGRPAKSTTSVIEKLRRESRQSLATNKAQFAKMLARTIMRVTTRRKCSS